MNKTELIANIKREREALNAILARVKPADMAEPGVCGHWSVKDIVAHLAVWASRTVTVMFQAERGKPTSFGVPNDYANDWANVNAKDCEEQRKRPLDRILADYHGSHQQLIKRLELWQDEMALFDKKRYPSLGGESLADLAHGNGDEHDAKHRIQIEAWLKTRG